VVKQLLEHSVDVKSRDKDGRTALSLAVYQGHYHVVNELIICQEVEIEIADNKGNTPLALAASEGHWIVTEHFLERTNLNINTSMKNEDGQTPLSLAAQGGHSRVVE
jgi:ankyrin repeat protein